MQFSWNFYTEPKTPAAQLATEALVDPRSGAVGIEYGPAMMWNTSYGMHRGQFPTRVTAGVWYHTWHGTYIATSDE